MPKTIRRIIQTPFQKFISSESSSGILLIIATLIALVWANSPYADTYKHLWEYEFGIVAPHFELIKPSILWINDGLMAIFFFYIGLEIKREFLIGELNTLKKIAFPIIGAIGGMAVPITFYILMNQNPMTESGWAIPMATDIAFSLAVLNLLGNRVPLSLKVFLTAFAIVDDLGAVIVIALFFSHSLNFTFLGLAVIFLIILYILSYVGFYSHYLILFFGLVIWVLFLESGVHPTISGILLAFAIPIRQKINTPTFIDNLVSITDRIKKAEVYKNPILSNEQISEVDELESWIEDYQSPLQQLEHELQDWVAYFIIPLFALANAGVHINSEKALDSQLIIIVLISLVVGKSLGVSGFVLLFSKLKIIEIPKDITKKHLIGVSLLAGIGFTMAIFITNLAFENSLIFSDSAKIGILLGSLISAIFGYLILSYKSTSKT